MESIPLTLAAVFLDPLDEERLPYKEKHGPDLVPVNLLLWFSISFRPLHDLVFLLMNENFEVFFELYRHQPTLDKTVLGTDKNVGNTRIQP